MFSTLSSEHAPTGGATHNLVCVFVLQSGNKQTNKTIGSVGIINTLRVSSVGIKNHK